MTNKRKVIFMEIKEKIINIINDKLKNPIYKTLQILNIKTILNQSNFTKKNGTDVYLVVIHFVYRNRGKLMT